MGRIRLIRAGLLASLVLLAWIPSAGAQDLSSTSTTRVWVDEKTGQLFIRPGHGRVPLNLGGAVEQSVIEQKVEERTREQVRAAVAESEAGQLARTAELQKQVSEIRPAWQSYLNNFQNKFRLGALAYLDYSMYTRTGFGPQFLENLNPTGPGNDYYNSFDINRIYLNAYFTPTDDWTLRVTPEIYRANGANQTGSTCLTATGGACSFEDRFGTTTGVASNLDGSLNFRLKYAYAQYSGLWNNLAPLKNGTVTVGAQQNPLLGWEEDFSQYRFVYLAPWNYLGLSSSQIGLQFAGPIRFGALEKTYLDYAFGVYDNGNFSTPEQSNTKQVMERLTVYPFGSDYRFQGLGLTGFWNYGWGDTTPDNQGVVETLKSNRAQFQRIAAILSYAAAEWNVAGEFDYGKNAFTLGNLFRASGPADAFGTPTGTPVTKLASKSSFLGNTKCGTFSSGGNPCYNIFGTYGPQTAIWKADLNNGRAREVGFDLLGHYHIPGTKLTVFGLFQWFMPNDNIRENPLDFQRFVAGISYQYNEYLRFALDTQNLLFYHEQFGITPAEASTFGYVPGSKFNGQLLPVKVPFKLGTNSTIPFLVPRDTHAIFLNMEFAY
jgi:hypothetical protein